MLDATPENKIALRNRLSKLLHATPYQHDAFMQVLNEYSQAHVDLVLGDLLANITGGAWSQSWHNTFTPFGGNASFYQNFPWEALMALLEKASPKAAAAAMTAPLLETIDSFLFGIVYYRTAAELTELLKKNIVDAKNLCENLRKKEEWLSNPKNGKKWLIALNATSKTETRQLISGDISVGTSDGEQFTCYESTIAFFLYGTHITSYEVLLEALDITHQKIFLKEAWVDYNMGCLRLRPLIHFLIKNNANPLMKDISSFCHLYNKNDTDTDLSDLIDDIVNPNDWQNRSTKTDFILLINKMIKLASPLSHWEIILKDMTSVQRRALFLYQVTEPLFNATRKDDHYDLIFLWAGKNNDRLALHMAGKLILQKMPRTEDRLFQQTLRELEDVVNNYAAEIDDLIRPVFTALEQSNDARSRQFYTKLHKKYPHIEVNKTLLMFSPNGTNVTQIASRQGKADMEMKSITHTTI